MIVTAKESLPKLLILSEEYRTLQTKSLQKLEY